MANFNSSMTSRFAFDEPPAAFMLRLGRREMQIRREVSKPHYSVNPILDCRPGDDPGHLQMLVLSRWMVTLSKARAGRRQ
jgi:hypothetical protein